MYVTFGESIRGYLAEPEQAGPHPTVVLLHERYGLFQHTLDLAEKFAQAGYVCLAPDLYSRVKDQTRLLAGEVHIPLHDTQVRQDIDAGYDYLKALPVVDQSRLVLMGVCLTGRYPITIGAYRDDLRALVVFYGGAGEKEWPASEHFPEPLADLFPRINAPVLGIFGERDHVIPVPFVHEFRNQLEKSNKSYEITIYPDMPHGWLNDRMPGRYRAEGAAAAWVQLMKFLDCVFSGGFPADRVRWKFEGDIAADYDPGKNVRLE
jgi:carboxymethylenebutenolidase